LIRMTVHEMQSTLAKDKHPNNYLPFLAL